MNQQLYPTDLTDSQWIIIQNWIPPAKSGGRPRSLDMRRVVNAILYLVVGGIQWRMLPNTIWRATVEVGFRTDGYTTADISFA